MNDEPEVQPEAQHSGQWGFATGNTSRSHWVRWPAGEAEHGAQPLRAASFQGSARMDFRVCVVRT